MPACPAIWHGDCSKLLGEPAAFARKLDALHAGDWVVVDEVQRAPVLLNAVDRLIEVTSAERFINEVRRGL